VRNLACGRLGRRIGARAESPNHANHSETDLCADAISGNNTPAATTVIQPRLFMRAIDYDAAYPSARSPVFGRDVIATSHPLASQAGMAMLIRGGNAVDAAVAAAMALTVVEPTGCGIGSDAFAIVWDGTELHGLNSSGRSPAAWTPARFAGRDAMPQLGWDSVTVPGAVAAWTKLAHRFGRLPLAEVAAPAIRFAREGFAVTPIIAKLWRRAAGVLGGQPGFAECFLPNGRAPRAGEVFRSEAHARTLESIAETAGESFYRGDLARAMVADARRHGGAMTLEDLAAHSADWVGTLSQAYADAVVHELPPNGQGIATLIGLGILETLVTGAHGVDDPDMVHLAIEATKLAMADVEAYVADPGTMTVSAASLLDPAYLTGRARLIDPARAGDPGHGAPGPGGTVCLSAADRSGMMVSFIQSNYMGFGSGVVVPGAGISLQNRGAGFSLRPGHANEVGPRKRPFHTIIPGFAMNRDGSPLMAFGLMGGLMQAQGHLQLAIRILAHGQNPQAAADAPRWRVLSGRKVAAEPGMNARLVEALKARGHEIVVERPDALFAFGGAQIVLRGEEGYMAGSDPRKDGQALAW
jgi:gamma-glutamyltranspeptidase/glutathione hydrolase